MLGVSSPSGWIPPASCSTVAGEKLAVDWESPITCCRRGMGETSSAHAPQEENHSVLLDADPSWEILPVPCPSSHPDLAPRAKAILSGVVP